MDKKIFNSIVRLMLIGAILVLAVNNIGWVIGAVKFVGGVLSPFIIGAALAFVLNVPMSFFESKVFVFRGKAARAKRPVSLVATLIALCLVIAMVLFLIIPELLDTIAIIIEKIPTTIERVVAFGTELFEENPIILEYYEKANVEWESYLQDIAITAKTALQNMLGSAFDMVSGTISTIVNVVIGLVFAIYVLLQKEKLASQAKRIIYAFVKNKWAEEIIRICALTSDVFHKFLRGQCIEAVILGLMFFIVMSISGLPYALLISVVIAVCSLVPVFGAFIGFAIGIFLLLFSSPVQALWFAVIFIIIQQLEGNLIYPYVVGSSVGLPAIWVLFAVSVGGSLLGVVGMLSFIPLCSVCYVLIREAVQKRSVKVDI